MTLISSNAFSVSQDVPYLDRAVVARTQQEVASPWEELDSLHASIVARPGVEPFLRDEAVVVLVPQVRWRFHKAFVAILPHCSCSVVNRLGLKEYVILGRIFVLCILQSLLSFLFIHLHKILLLVC